MRNKPITTELVNKLISTVNAGLCKGIGLPTPGEMCVEAAVCYAYGIPHSDNPPCVGSAVRDFKIRLNDSNWSSNQARAKGMLALSIAQLNSNVLDQGEFAKRIILKMINNFIAHLPKRRELEISKKLRIVDHLGEAKMLCEMFLTGRDNDPPINYAIDAIHWHYLRNFDFCASKAAKISEKIAILYYMQNERDRVLTKAAALCLEVLKEMKSPGCEYLYLINQ